MDERTSARLAQPRLDLDLRASLHLRQDVGPEPGPELVHLPRDRRSSPRRRSTRRSRPGWPPSPSRPCPSAVPISAARYLSKPVLPFSMIQLRVERLDRLALQLLEHRRAVPAAPARPGPRRSWRTGTSSPPTTGRRATTPRGPYPRGTAPAAPGRGTAAIGAGGVGAGHDRRGGVAERARHELHGALRRAAGRRGGSCQSSGVAGRARCCGRRGSGWARCLAP